MSRVRAFFVEEATGCLAAAREELAGAPDPESLHSALRKLRGSAQVARFGALAEEARTLERLLKPLVREGRPWDADVARRVADGLDSLTDAVEAVRDGRTEQDEREPAMDEQTSNEAGGAAEVVPMETLEYQGAAALGRAETLREPLEDAIVNGDPPGTILDELFDLIRLGTK